MAHKLFAIVALASAATLTNHAFAGEQVSTVDWKSPQVVGQPGY